MEQITRKLFTTKALTAKAQPRYKKTGFTTKDAKSTKFENLCIGTLRVLHALRDEV
jgi:hypothetical protein